MDYKYIEQLLERYWNCETTLEEEKILRTFFSQKDIPVRLMPYRELFNYEQLENKDDALGDDFDARMLALVNEPEPVKARVISLRQRLMPLFKAAAMVAIVLTLGNAAQVAFKDEGHQTAPATAFQKLSEGPSVAMGDSAKADTMKVVGVRTTMLK